jgi:hypothetical protein
LVLNGVKACFGVREDADPVIVFVFVQCDTNGGCASILMAAQGVAVHGL